MCFSQCILSIRSLLSHLQWLSPADPPRPQWRPNETFWRCFLNPKPPQNQYFINKKTIRQIIGNAQNIITSIVYMTSWEGQIHFTGIRKTFSV